MKKRSIIILLIVTENFIFSKTSAQQSIPVNRQELIGLWQEGSPIVSSGLQAVIRFYKKDKFIYQTSSYDDLNPLLCIFGTYKINHDSLWLKVDSSRRLVGTKIVGASKGFQFGLFTLLGGEITTIIQKRSDYEWHSISNCLNDTSKKCIIIDDNLEKYYKLSSNPDKFKGD